jgi:gas vesicle protein
MQNGIYDRNTNNMALVGLFAGAVLGAGIALLLAPTAGPETRRKLGRTVKRWGSDLKDVVKERLEQGGSFETREGHESYSNMEPSGTRSSY